MKEKTIGQPPAIVQPSSEGWGRDCPSCGKNSFYHTDAESDACWEVHKNGYKAAKPKTKQERLWRACRKGKHASDAANESQAERTKRQAAIYAKFLGDTKAAAVKRIVEQINENGIKPVFFTVGEILTDSGVKNPIGAMVYRLKNNAAVLAV